MASLVYSSDDGAITASQVIRMLQDWAMDTEDPSLSLDGNSSALSAKSAAQHVCLWQVEVTQQMQLPGVSLVAYCWGSFLLQLLLLLLCGMSYVYNHATYNNYKYYWKQVIIINIIENS